jgi:hypothetical protein
MKLSSSMRLLAAVAIVALPSLAFADTISFVAPAIQVAASANPTTGYFDVAITNTTNGTTTAPNQNNSTSTDINTNGSDNVTGIQVDVLTSGTLNFINEDASTTLTYIYATNSNGNAAGAISNQEVYNLDTPSNAGTSVVSGTPLGLMRVEYVIPGGTPVGTVFPLTLGTPTNGATVAGSWGDNQFNPNTPTYVNGSITVTPEPTSMVLFVLGAIGLFGIRRLRSR